MASRSVNKVILIGHLGRDAETAYTASQVAVTKFSVATNRRWKDQQSGEWKEETDWSRVVLWRGENLAYRARISEDGDPDQMAGSLPLAHSTVTDFARFLGLSTSVPRSTAV